VQTTKQCTKCGKSYPTTAEFFYSNSRGGLFPTCKNCFRKAAREYKASPKGRAARRRYAKNHPVAVAVHRKTYYDKLSGHLRLIYHNMCARCSNPKHTSFKWYGNKGIKVLFKDFDSFYQYVTQEMGITSIDQIRGKHFHRKDSTKGYQPDNLELLTEPEHYQLHLKERRETNDKC